MIGKVTSKSGTVAVLNDDAVWECEDADVQAQLNQRFSPLKSGDYLSILGPNGAINAAARWMGGEAEYANPPKPLPPDVVS